MSEGGRREGGGREEGGREAVGAGGRERRRMEGKGEKRDIESNRRNRWLLRTKL